MKYIITLICTLAIVIIACNTKLRSESESIFSTPDSFKAEEYTINVDRDTTLVTKHGALLKIPKGALSISPGNTVKLEIKEAYTIQQMIAAGLYTQSDGDPLSSGGMISIEPASGQNVTINQPIKVAIPANSLLKGMQLYKGVKDEKGNINWKDPSPLVEDPRLAVFEKGQQIFQSKCASCHTLGKDGSGPDLAHFVNRFASSPWADGEAFYMLSDHGLSSARPGGVTEVEYTMPVDSSTVGTDTTSSAGSFRPDQHYYHYDHPYAYKCNLISKYKTAGPAFLNSAHQQRQKKRDKNSISLSPNEMDTLLRFIQYESNRLNLPLPSHAYLNDCIDSCARYRETINRIENEKTSLQTKTMELEIENGQMVQQKKRGNGIPEEPVQSLPPVDFDGRVSPESYGATYYQFTIESFGWYNIDILLNDVNDVRESELFVRITGEYREKVQLYLIIPSVKVYGQGGPAARNAAEFTFFYKTGKLPLPQNTTAYIMAVTETSESIAYALKEFTTSTRQEFDIPLQRATKEEFNAAIKVIGAGDMTISVTDSKHATEIRKTDAELKALDEKLKTAESLKPRNCDCDCGSSI